MSAFGVGIDVQLKGYIFECLEDITYWMIIDGFEDLQSFFVCYVMPAWRDKQSCVVMNSSNELVFYMQKGQVIHPQGQSWDDWFQLMHEG